MKKRLFFGLLFIIFFTTSVLAQRVGIPLTSQSTFDVSGSLAVLVCSWAAVAILLIKVRHVDHQYRNGVYLSALLLTICGLLFLMRIISWKIPDGIENGLMFVLAAVLIGAAIGLVRFFSRLPRDKNSLENEKDIYQRAAELRDLNQKLELEIESRKIAEREVAKREKRFRALIENIHDGIVLNDEHSNVLYQSPSVTRILGYMLEERRGKPVLNYVHEQDKQLFLRLYEELATMPGQPIKFQFRVRHQHGHYVWLEGVVTNMLHDRNVNGYVANYRDISERKQAEEKLGQERYLLRTLIDNLPVYIYIKDLELRHVINNKANVELIGAQSEEETLGKTVLDYFDSDVVQKFMDADRQVLSTGKPIIDLEEEIINQRGEKRWLLTSKIPLMENQEVVGLIGISRDITDRKNAEIVLTELNASLATQAEKLTASNAELERFAYIASHDLQEPLRMVRSFLQLLKKRFESQMDSEAREYIDFAVDGAERMKTLITDLLEYSRLGVVSERRELIDTNNLLQRTTEVMRPSLEAAAVRLTVNILPSVIGVRTQLSQVFQNLIGNAIKYRSEDQPYIVVDGTEDETHWIFSVADNGIGIDPRFVDKIFEIFQRLHPEGKTKGAGIGLAICKRIVEAHGGRIWVDTVEGSGSTFYFTLRKPG